MKGHSLSGPGFVEIKKVFLVSLNLDYVFNSLELKAVVPNLHLLLCLYGPQKMIQKLNYVITYSGTE